MAQRTLLVSILSLGLAACGGSDEADSRNDSPDQAETPAADVSPQTPAPDQTEGREASPRPGKVVPLTPNGWGPITIGMTREEVTAAVGEDPDPGLVGGPGPEACEELRPADASAGVMVMIERGELTRITIAGESEIVTERNIGLSADAATVKAAYPEAVVMPHKYLDAPAEYITAWSVGGLGDEPYVQNPDARGIRYEIGDNGRVEAIHAGGPAIQYVEGCL